jgi:hypothetical protein
MFRLFLTIAFFLSPCLGAEPAKPRIISLNLCCLRYAGEARSFLLKSSPSASPTEVPIYQGGFTEPVPVVVEEGKVVVYRKGRADEAPWMPLWSFAVPADGSNVSAILLPISPKNAPSSPYTAFFLPATKDFVYGSVLAINLTPHNARLDLGRKKLSLPPGASQSADLASEVDAFDMVPVAAWMQRDAQWQSLHTTRWAYNARYRQVTLIWMDPTANRAEMTSIREMKAMPPP